MFVDTLNAPPDAIGGTVLRVAEQLGANMIVTTSDCYVRSPVSNQSIFGITRIFPVYPIQQTTSVGINISKDVSVYREDARFQLLCKRTASARTGPVCLDLV